jgi:IS30 family transposase
MAHHHSKSRTPGPPPRTAERTAFARLIAQGVTNSEACRRVGINRRTGTRWRYGRTITNSAGRALQYPAVMSTRRRVISPRFLSEEERVVIADRHRARATVRSIAAELGRSPSAISRELSRNRDPGTGQYRPFTAHRLAAARRARPKPRKLASDVVLQTFVLGRLEKRWSPEQICHALRQVFPDEPERHLVHETIYQALYARDGGLHADQCRALRTGRRRRRPRRRAGARRPGGLAQPMAMIDERPGEAADRTVPGHWEGDLLMGAGNRSAIGTIVERATRHVILVHLPRGRTAEAVGEALAGAVDGLPSSLRRSLTWNQGKEMSRHDDVAKNTGMPVFFCEPASPWQRGTNENTNGLLRQYFPKGTDLSRHSAGHLAAVAAKLNGRPRKSLDWETPAQRLAQLLAPAVDVPTARRDEG